MQLDTIIREGDLCLESFCTNQVMSESLSCFLSHSYFCAAPTKKNTIAVMKLQIRNNILVVDCKLIGAEMNLEKLTSFENWTLHWMKEVCFDMYLHSYRSGYLRYDSEVTEKSIKLYRFKVPEDMYRSGDEYPPNKGFCVPPGCLPSGLLNISLCQPMSKWSTSQSLFKSQ